MPAKRLASAAILAALLTAILFLLQHLPTGQTAGLVILSLLPGVWFRRGGGKEVPLACLASVLLGTLLGIRPSLLTPYALFFAWYASVWVFSETRSRPRLIRLLWGQIALLAACIGFTALGGRLSPLVLYILAAEAALVLFDLFFGLCVAFYDRRLAPRLR